MTQAFLLVSCCCFSTIRLEFVPMPESVGSDPWHWQGQSTFHVFMEKVAHVIFCNIFFFCSLWERICVLFPVLSLLVLNASYDCLSIAFTAFQYVAPVHILSLRVTASACKLRLIFNRSQQIGFRLYTTGGPNGLDIATSPEGPD